MMDVKLGQSFIGWVCSGGKLMQLKFTGEENWQGKLHAAGTSSVFWLENIFSTKEELIKALSDKADKIEQDAMQKLERAKEKANKLRALISDVTAAKTTEPSPEQLAENYIDEIQEARTDRGFDEFNSWEESLLRSAYLKGYNDGKQEQTK